MTRIEFLEQANELVKKAIEREIAEIEAILKEREESANVK